MHLFLQIAAQQSMHMQFDFERLLVHLFHGFYKRFHDFERQANMLNV